MVLRAQRLPTQVGEAVDSVNTKCNACCSAGGKLELQVFVDEDEEVEAAVVARAQPQARKSYGTAAPGHGAVAPVEDDLMHFHDATDVEDPATMA